MLLKLCDVIERHNMPEIINFFVICVNLRKSTLLILFQANFIEIFVKVDPHIDYTIHFRDLLGLNLFVSKLEDKKLFCIAFIGREQTIYSSIT